MDESRSHRWPVLLAAGGIIAATMGAYANSFHGPFIFDDAPSIAENLSIRHLWPVWPLFSPPGGGLTVEGRPVLNLSFALNYAIGGTQVTSYHAFNLIIHIAAALVLLGIMRRTLERFHDRSSSLILAVSVALLWALHPLQTESVTYIVQRAESLMGLFYLLTLYSFIRGTEPDVAGVADPGSPPQRGRPQPYWLTMSWLACLLGTATKEVMVSAPLIVLLYDRTFVAGSFWEALKKRGAYYVSLAATWGLLGWLVHSTHDRGGTAGFASGMPGWIYWVTQPAAIVRYLRLSVWPHPLVFDYGFTRSFVQHPALAAPYAVAVLGLAAAVVWLFFRPQDPKKPGGRAIGFAGVFFFAILAPTSVVPGTRQSLAEHRMYLALVPVIAVAICGAFALVRRARAVLAVSIAVAAAFGALTFLRNRVYRTEVAIWADTSAKVPDNPYALNSLGSMLYQAGRTEEAREALEAALRLYPDYAEARGNLGTVLAKLGRNGEALSEFHEALELKPQDPKIHTYLGYVLGNLGRTDEAEAQFRESIRLKPDYAVAHQAYGNLLLQEGRDADCRAELTEAARLRPDVAEVYNNLGNALAQLGQLPESAAALTEAVHLEPANAEAYNNLAITYAQMGRLTDAAAAFGQALRLMPNSPEAHNNFANVLRSLHRIPEARAQYIEALRLNPDYEDARANLERLPAR